MACISPISPTLNQFSNTPLSWWATTLLYGCFPNGPINVAFSSDNSDHTEKLRIARKIVIQSSHQAQEGWARSYNRRSRTVFKPKVSNLIRRHSLAPTLPTTSINAFSELLAQQVGHSSISPWFAAGPAGRDDVTTAIVCKQ